jgi:arylsulfatase
MYKHHVHEGGISTPLIAHWPGGIARKGELERQPGHLIDLMPTFVQLAGAEYPQKKGERDVTPMQGAGLAAAFAGKSLDRAQPIFFEHEGNRAIRDGKWKLVAKGVKGKWELYDVEADRSEMHDLSGEQPERVSAMAAQWQQWAEKTNVLPLVPWQKKKRS